MDAVFGVIAVAVALVIGAVVLREYVQRVKRFRQLEAEHDAMRERVKHDLAQGTRLRPATHLPPPPPPTRYVNDAIRPAPRSAATPRQTLVAPRTSDEPTWAAPTLMPSYDYDPPPAHSHSSMHSSSHHSFSGGGGGSFDGGGASSDWSSSSDSCSSSDSSSSSCSSD